jgi:hypothetical protein
LRASLIDAETGGYVIFLLRHKRHEPRLAAC